MLSLNLTNAQALAKEYADIQVIEFCDGSFYIVVPEYLMNEMDFSALYMNNRGENEDYIEKHQEEEGYAIVYVDYDGVPSLDNLSTYTDYLIDWYDKNDWAYLIKTLVVDNTGALPWLYARETKSHKWEVYKDFTQKNRDKI